MARNDSYLAKSFYFCGVKNQLRHVVAGKTSVFRAPNLVGKIHPNDGGRSNARKGTAYDTLTHRIGVFICQKVMQSNNGNEPKDVRLTVIESIQEYLEDFRSVDQLYERAAKALAALVYCSPKIAQEDKSRISDMVQDYMCLLDLLKPLEEKGGEA